MSLSKLTDMQLDAVREISGIGAGHAATTLSGLLDRTIRLEVPSIEVIDITEVPGIFGGPEQIVGAVYTRLAGDIDGAALFVAAPDAVRALITMLGEEPAAIDDVPDDRLAGVLLDVVDKLIGSYLSAISDMTGLAVGTAESAWAYDMAGALLEAVVAEIGMSADSAVLVRTAFIDEGRSVEVAFFFVPDPDSLQVILGRLGLA